MATATRIVKNTGFLYIKMGITVFISLYTTRLVLESLGVSDFGVFNIVGGAISMLGFLNSTMAFAIQRFMSYAEGEGSLEKKKHVFNVSMIVQAIVAAITCAVLLAFMYPLFNGVLNIVADRIFAAKIVYLSLVVSTLLTIVNVPYDAVMNAHENMLYYSLIGILESLLKLAVAFVCVYTSGDKLIVYGVLMAVIPLLTLSIMKVYCHWKYEECCISLRRYWDVSLLRQILSFSGWNFLTAVSSMFTAYGGGLVLNHYFGTVLNAAQGIANQVNGQMSAFSTNLMKAVNPVITKKAGAKDYASLNHVTLAGCKISTLLIILFAIPFILEMPYVLRIWLHQVPEWTMLFCCCQLLITIVQQMASSASSAIYAQGHIKPYTIWKSVMNLLPIVVTFIAYALGGAPYWYYIAMLLLWAIGGDVVVIVYARRLCGLSVRSFLREVVMPLTLICVLMMLGGGAFRVFMAESFLRLVVCCLSTTLILGFSAWHLVLNADERVRIKQKAFSIAKKYMKI